MWHPRVWAEVRLDRLQANLRTVARAVGSGVEIMAVVKADAYGHGAIPVARALLDAGASRLGVGDSTEAIELRASGITAPIHVLGAIVEREVEELIYHGITPMIHSLERARLLDEHARRAGRKIAVHIMVDTGMGRLGVRPESAEELMLEVARRPALHLDGVATHLSSADTDPAFTREQIALFDGVLARARELRIPVRRVHAAATCGLFLFPEARYNLVRPGAELYGIDPANLAGRGFPIEPVLSFKTQVVFTKHVEAGTPIGYGAMWRAPRATRIATLACGYDDGYPRSLSGKGACALVRGRRAPVVGSVTMDYLMLDIGEIPEATVGDVVTLYGRDGDAEVRVEEIARLAGTIPYEIPCRLGKRVRRVYLAGGEIGGFEESGESVPGVPPRPALVMTDGEAA